MKLTPRDVYDESGDLLRIEFFDSNGDFVVQSVWDENDPQDTEHREFFRRWSYKMMDQLGHEVDK